MLSYSQYISYVSPGKILLPKTLDGGAFGGKSRRKENIAV